MQFPLPLSDFVDALPLKRVTFRLADEAGVSRTRGGDVIRHRRGARLWGGELEIDIDHHDAQAGAEALLARLEEPDASFLLYDIRKPMPVSDPAGAVASSPVKIAGLSADGWSLSLSGLPAGFQITCGDLLSFTYGTSPLRYALHRATIPASANSQGATGAFDVVPPIRPGAVVGAGVKLVKPVLKARLVEADYGKGKATISDGGRARWVQSLR